MTENTEAGRESLLERCDDSTPRDRRHMRYFLGVTLAWAITFVGATWLIKRELLPEGPVSWLVALVPTIAGLVVCLVYARYLRNADELQRALQLRALGMGFAAGWLALSGYPLLERVGAPAIDPSDYTLVMAVFFSLGLMLGLRRYR